MMIRPKKNEILYRAKSKTPSATANRSLPIPAHPFESSGNSIYRVTQNNLVT